MQPNVNKEAQLSGILLRLLYVNHNAQGPHTNSTVLRAVLQREGYDFTGDEVLTALQVLRDREYVRYQQRRDFAAGRLFLFEIEITAKGRDVFSGLIRDPAVDVR
jgi:hypothetical protein